MATKCPKCGTEMMPLLTSEYCPNDCDRIVEKAIEDDVTPKWFDLGEYAEVLGSPMGWFKPGSCSRCGSDEVEPFDSCAYGDTHCKSCGKVWYA